MPKRPGGRRPPKELILKGASANPWTQRDTALHRMSQVRLPISGKLERRLRGEKEIEVDERFDMTGTHVPDDISEERLNLLQSELKEARGKGAMKRVKELIREINRIKAALQKKSEETKK